MSYDYGDRQERVDHLLKALERLPPEPRLKVAGASWSPEELAAQIREGTDLGREVVAVAGFVYQALSAHAQVAE